MSFFAQYAQFFIQFAVVLLCILAGAQVGGIGLGVFGGIGLAILSFGFGLEPTSPPIDVMLMIMAVVSAAAAMQAAGGLDYMIKIATRVLHKNPKYITFIAPMVTYTFTVLAGTGHVAYSVLPVIAEVSRKNGIRQALILDDTHNANPDSMKAALDVLAKLPAPRGFVMGDMGELGEDEAAAMHAAGHSFYLSDNQVWLTDHVPPQYISEE